MITQFYLNGQLSNPANRDEITFVVDYADRRRLVDIDLSVDTLTFVAEDRQSIISWLQQFGWGAGMPVEVQMTPTLTQRYYIDFTDGFSWTDNEITVKIKRRNAINNFFDSADATVWRIVNFSPSDFRDVDYVIVPDVQPLYVISLLGLTLSLRKELATAIDKISQNVEAITKASVPVGVPPAPDWGAIIVASLRLAANIAYTIAIAIAFINVITEVINLIIPIIRTFRGITYKRLIEVGCAYLGYQLQSNFLNEIQQLVVLPKPLRPTDANVFQEMVNPLGLAYTEGFPTEQDVIPTIGTAIDQLCEIYNLRITAVEGVVTIEREDYFTQLNPNPVPFSPNLQEEKQFEYSLNDDYWVRKLLLWQVDPSDINTFDDNKGQIAEIGAALQVDPNPDIRLIKGLDQVDNRFSLGTRKDELTFGEKVLKVLAKAVDLFTGGSLEQLVDNRVGVLQVSQQYYGNTKLLWMSGNRIAINHKEKLGAINILREYHDDFEVKAVVENHPVRMTKEEFLLYSEQYFVILNDGREAEIRSINWNEQDNLATMTLWIDTDFNTNIQFNELENGGL